MTKEEYICNIKQLNLWTKLYDESNPIISDEEWDDLYFDCQLFEEETGYIHPDSPTNSISYENDARGHLKKIKHDHPMLSLAKTKDNNVLKKWCGSKRILVMHKCDGLTLSLHYDNGKFVSAETRGNGTIGEDVTANALRVKSIPKTIKYKKPLIIDGEILCKLDDFEEFEDEFSNARNFASGSIGLDDPNECERRNLTFVAWDKIDGDEDLDKKLDFIESLGFVTVYREYLDLDNLEAQQDRMRHKAAELMIPTDGLVYKIINYAEYMSMGVTGHHFSGGFAFKYYDLEYETTLIDIKWTVGRTGVITPTAIFKTVDIDGAQVSQACLHNITVMTKLLGPNPYVGQKIWVIRANMVIPQVKRAEKTA